MAETYGIWLLHENTTDIYVTLNIFSFSFWFCISIVLYCNSQTCSEILDLRPISIPVELILTGFGEYNMIIRKLILFIIAMVVLKCI